MGDLHMPTPTTIQFLAPQTALLLGALETSSYNAGGLSIAPDYGTRKLSYCADS